MIDHFCIRFKLLEAFVTAAHTHALHVEVKLLFAIVSNWCNYLLRLQLGGALRLELDVFGGLE